MQQFPSQRAGPTGVGVWPANMRGSSHIPIQSYQPTTQPGPTSSLMPNVGGAFGSVKISNPHQPLQQQQLQHQPQQMYIQKKLIEKYSYYLPDVIGQGYSSMVYQGKNEETGEVVAVKVIDMKGISNEVQSFLLRNEISVLRKLSSNINSLRLLDVIYTANNTYIITEFCDHGDLKELIGKYGTFPERTAVRILKQLLFAIAEMQKQGVIHRDLKLANILVREGIPKIADFGFSKDLTAEPCSIFYNVGTPMYMSPQSLTQNVYSFKSDIWSVGVLFYEMLYGVTPWMADTEQELINKIYSQPVCFPPSVLLSSDAEDFILNCLKIDEEVRYDLTQMTAHPIFHILETPVRTIFQSQQTSQLQQSQLLQQQTQQQQELVASILPTINSTTTFEQPDNISEQYPHSPLQSASETSMQTRHFNSNNSPPQNQEKTSPQLQSLIKVQSQQLQQLSNCQEQQSLSTVTLQSSISLHPPLSEENQGNKVQQQETLLEEVRVAKNKQSGQENKLIALSQVNFCRFLYRLQLHIRGIEKLAEGDLGTCLILQKVTYLVLKNIMMKVARLSSMAVEKENTLKMKEFTVFISDERFEKFQFAVNEYASKYSEEYIQFNQDLKELNLLESLSADFTFASEFNSSSIESQSFYITTQTFIREAVQKLILYLSEKLAVSETSDFIDDQHQGVIVLLDYLVTYYQLTQLILEKFDDFALFARLSKINQIADGKPVKLTKLHFLSIKAKILSLGI